MTVMSGGSVAIKPHNASAAVQLSRTLPEYDTAPIIQATFAAFVISKSSSIHFHL
jgi:hypothetical protein